MIKLKDILKEWTDDKSFKNLPKRWSKSYTDHKWDGLTEFEKQGGKDSVNEGPAYEYANSVKKIEKLEKQLEKSIMDFKKILLKKGLRDEGMALSSKYITHIGGFKQFLAQLVRKLM